jgi:hypothetical protein
MTLLSGVDIDFTMLKMIYIKRLLFYQLEEYFNDN